MLSTPNPQNPQLLIPKVSASCKRTNRRQDFRTYPTKINGGIK